MKLNDHQLINLGFVLVALGILPILLPLGSAALVTGLVTVGLGCAPIYPNIIHETPLNFGRNLSMALTGVQMAATYVGNVVFPPLFGLLARYISISLYPWYLLAALVLMAVMSRALHRKTAAKRCRQRILKNFDFLPEEMPDFAFLLAFRYLCFTSTII